MHHRNKISAAALLALSGLAGFAQAQTAPVQTIDRVEVTGSRIRQIDIETSQPILKMTQEDIQKSGLVTVGDIINSMSSAGSPAFSKGAVLTSNREQGGQYINLRNLGAQRLLVLVNGKRWTQTVAGYTDLSTVPSALIDRVEVLKDGASSIYGSDAIAGVVNIILKKSLEGGTFSAYNGQNEKGDGRQEDYSLAFGASNDKASMMVGLSYSKVEPVWSRTRDITSTTYGPDHPTASLGTSPWGRIRQVNPVTGGARGFNQILNHTGDQSGVGTGQDSRNPGSYHTYAGAAADAYNSTQDMMFQSGTELTTIFTKGSLEITPAVRLNGTAMYADRNSARQIAGYPLNSGTQSNYMVYIDKDSYYNPYGNQVAGAGNGQDLFFYRRTIERPRVTANNNKTFHVDGNLEGDLTLGGNIWGWSLGTNFSKVSGTVLSTGNLNLLNLKKALGPSFKNANGVIQCGTAANPIALGTCVPFNILGGPSASDSAALDYVMSTGQATYGSSVRSMTADVNGELFSLPAGKVGVAAGVERREVRGYDRPGQFEQSGFSTDLAGNPTSGQYVVKEAYAEINVPVLKNVFMAEQLNLNFASRYSDYSNFGSTTNSKASFVWKPIKDLLTRGTYAEGFRAPTVGDTFGGGSQSFDSYLDPCDMVNGQAGKATGADTKARCLAAGVPANYRQLNQAGLPVGAGGGQSTVPFLAGAGNNTLTPETATTKTLGFVYSPSQLAGLTASLDWYKISIKNRITAVSAGYILNQCYVSGVPSFCTLFKRDSTGMVTNLARGNANLGEVQTEGFDLGLNYKLPKNSYGQFGIRSESSYVSHYKTKSTATADFTEYAGEYPLYRFKSNIGLDWKKGDWGATFATRYYSGVKTNCWDTNVECSNPGEAASWGTDVDHKSALIYNDLSVSYTTPWKGTLLVGSNNVFNKKPRIVYDASGNLGGNSSSASVDPDLPLDRFFFVRYSQSF
jgi:iron complex outermembrane receptor protein